MAWCFPPVAVVIDKLSMTTQERKLFRMVSRQKTDKRCAVAAADGCCDVSLHPPNRETLMSTCLPPPPPSRRFLFFFPFLLVWFGCLRYDRTHRYEKAAQMLVRMWLGHIVHRRRLIKRCEARNRMMPASAASIWSKLKPFVKECRQARHERMKLGSNDHETDPVELLLALTKQNKKMAHEMQAMSRQLTVLTRHVLGPARAGSGSSTSTSSRNLMRVSHVSPHSPRGGGNRASSSRALRTPVQRAVSNRR